MKKLASPLLQLPVLVLLVVGIGWLHVGKWPDPERYLGGGALLLYSAWPLLEAAAIARENRRSSAEQDRGTYLTYAVARVVTVIITVALAASQAPPQWVVLAGMALLVGGMLLRTAAIRALGSAYSNRVRWDEQSTVVSHGPYRLLRHPSYTGMLLGHLGLAIAVGSVAGIVAVSLVLLPGIVRRVLVEERALSTSADWTRFAAARSRLVPWLW